MILPDPWREAAWSAGYIVADSTFTCAVPPGFEFIPEGSPPPSHEQIVARLNKKYADLWQSNFELREAIYRVVAGRRVMSPALRRHLRGLLT